MKSLRFWLLIAATLYLLFAITSADEIPQAAKEHIEAHGLFLGLTIEGLIVGMVCIGFATMLVCVQRHLKHLESNQEK